MVYVGKWLILLEGIPIIDVLTPRCFCGQMIDSKKQAHPTGPMGELMLRKKAAAMAAFFDCTCSQNSNFRGNFRQGSSSVSSMLSSDFSTIYAVTPTEMASAEFELRGCRFLSTFIFRCEPQSAVSLSLSSLNRSILERRSKFRVGARLMPRASLLL